MTIKEAAQKAVQTHDIRMFGAVVDQLRTMGFDYKSTAEFFRKNTGIDAHTFESFCYESDSSGD